MAELRAELQAALAQLLASSEESRTLTLDAIGDALGTLSVGTDEIDALLSALEAEGRDVLGPVGEGAEAHLKRVVGAARELKQGAQRPTLGAVAARSQLTPEQVLAALALLRIMQR